MKPPKKVRTKKDLKQVLIYDKGSKLFSYGLGGIQFTKECVEEEDLKTLKMALLGFFKESEAHVKAMIRILE